MSSNEQRYKEAYEQYLKMDFAGKKELAIGLLSEIKLEDETLNSIYSYLTESSNVTLEDLDEVMRAIISSRIEVDNEKQNEAILALQTSRQKLEERRQVELNDMKQ